MLLSSIYRKRIIGKQARVEWSIGVIGAVALLATVGLIESDAALRHSDGRTDVEVGLSRPMLVLPYCVE